MESKLNALRPLISVLMEEEYPEGIDISDIAIEADLTCAEREIITRGVRRYYEHPEEFVTLDSIREKKI